MIIVNDTAQPIFKLDTKLTHQPTVSGFDFHLDIFDTVPIGPIVYGLGGCSGNLVVSPAPACLPVYPVEQPYIPVVVEPTHVPLPSAVLLFGIGLLVLWLSRR